MLRQRWLTPRRRKSRSYSTKDQLLTGEPHNVVAKTVSKIEGLLGVSGASLAYAGYPYDPFASFAKDTKANDADAR